MKAVRFEALEESFLPAILEIEAEANSSPWSEKSFKNELINPQSIFRVIRAGGQLAGYGGLWLCVDEAHVTNVAIRKDLRGQGLGRRLMVDLLERAKDQGMTCSTLEVRASNEAALKLYERLGYQRAALRKRYYPDNQEDAVVMWLYELQSWTP